MPSIEPIMITRAGSSAVRRRLQLGQQRLGQQERRLHVDVEHLVEPDLGELAEVGAPTRRRRC
jgi:hypothetical protein